MAARLDLDLDEWVGQLLDAEIDADLDADEQRDLTRVLRPVGSNIIQFPSPCYAVPGLVRRQLDYMSEPKADWRTLLNMHFGCVSNSLWRQAVPRILVVLILLILTVAEFAAILTFIG